MCFSGVPVILVLGVMALSLFHNMRQILGDFAGPQGDEAASEGELDRKYKAQGRHRKWLEEEAGQIKRLALTSDDKMQVASGQIFDSRSAAIFKYGHENGKIV